MKWKHTSKQLEELSGLIRAYLKAHQAMDIQGKLIHELMLKVLAKIEKKAFDLHASDKLKINLTLNSIESKAFVIWWLSLDDDGRWRAWPLGRTVAQEMSNVIHQANTGIEQKLVIN